MQEIFLAGGCLWGVQEYFRHVPGVVSTRAGRANGSNHSTSAAYDGYAECVQIHFDETMQSVHGLMEELFDIIDPYALNRQGEDIGEKYRTGVYSRNAIHLEQALAYIRDRSDSERIAVEVLPLVHFLESDPEHQDRLQRCPADYCHIASDLLNKYRQQHEK